MGFLVAVVVIGILGFMAFGLFGMLGVAGVFRAEKKNLGKADETLDTTFDGRDDVTFHITLVSLPFEAVVAGAKARGYRLAHQSGADQYGTQTLMFERTGDVTP